MCLNLNDYQFKTSRYSYGSAYLNSMVTTNQKNTVGNFLVAQWLGLGAFTDEAQVQSLFGELRSHKPRGTAPPNKKIKSIQ